GLVQVEVTGRMEQDHAARAVIRVHAKHRLLRHGPARQEDGRRLPQQARDLALQLLHHTALAVPVGHRVGGDLAEELLGRLPPVPVRAPRAGAWGRPEPLRAHPPPATSRRPNAPTPSSAAKAPRPSSQKAAGQFGLAAGTGAMWSSGEVSRSQWFELNADAR